MPAADPPCSNPPPAIRSPAHSPRQGRAMEHSSNLSPYKPFPGWLVFGLALVLGAVGARPYAGSWNDGSRLAAVQSLGDHGTFAIDRSLFVQPPRDLSPDAPRPYATEDEFLMERGTLD